MRYFAFPGFPPDRQRHLIRDTFASSLTRSVLADADDIDESDDELLVRYPNSSTGTRTRSRRTQRVWI
ncbi:hypothetical protein C7T36_06955 [Rhodococcus sp. AD45-ID]|nr:hypothetical protein C7T36_06955 [Rhodococcus sp. AD45-ID]